MSTLSIRSLAADDFGILSFLAALFAKKPPQVDAGDAGVWTAGARGL